MNQNNSYHNFILNFLSNIDNDIGNSKLAIFVGSGISVCSGYPTWDNVIKKFAEPLGTPIDKLQNKDYLEIPDKFFHKYKSYEFKKLLKDIFDIAPNNLDLQEKILQINPYHIITTNWDNLLETVMLKTEDRYYDIVNNDNDLSKVNNTKLIIKMHGSLLKLDDNDNAIVMKESDYASYSDNFPLIENYIKSIFSTKRVLFIGYSLSDRNVQQILHWVKNRTLNHIFPYLIVNGRYDEIEFSFYKEKGVFLIYFDEILDFIGKSEKLSYLEKYNAILDLVINRKQSIQKNESIINKVYDLLKKHEEVNFLSPDLLIDILKDKFDISVHYGVFGDQGLHINEVIDNLLNEELVDILKHINRLSEIIKKKKDYKYKPSEKELYVLHKLYESNITKVSIGFEGKITCNLSSIYQAVLEDNGFNLYQSLLNYDLNTILQYSNEQLASDMKNTDRTKIKLLKAYTLYKMEQYDESILILQNIQKSSYINKDFFIYFIAKMNLKYICRIKKFSFDENGNLKTFCEQYKIDDEQIQEEIYNLPTKYNKKYIFKAINFDYFYKRFFNIQKLYDENLKTKIMFQKGGSSSNNSHSEIYNDSLNIVSMINFNFMTIDKFSDIKDIYSKAFQAIILNYSIIDNFSSEKLRERLSFPVNQFKKLDQFIFYLAINSSGKYSELSAFLKDTLEIHNDNKIDYKKLEFYDLENIVNVMLRNINQHNKKSIFDSGDLLNKSIVILSWAQLEDKHIEEVLKIFIEMLSNITDWSDYDIINIFLTNQFQSIKSDNLKLLEIILDKFILKFIIGNTFIDEQTMKRNNFTEITFRILKENQYTLKISLDKIFTFCSKLPMREEPEFSLYTMSLIYSLNKEMYSDLRERHIQMLLNDIERKEFAINEASMKVINQLLDIEQ